MLRAAPHCAITARPASAIAVRCGERDLPYSTTCPYTYFTTEASQRPTLRSVTVRMARETERERDRASSSMSKLLLAEIDSLATPLCRPYLWRAGGPASRSRRRQVAPQVAPFSPGGRDPLLVCLLARLLLLSLAPLYSFAVLTFERVAIHPTWLA